MGSLAESKQIKELRDIVAPGIQWSEKGRRAVVDQGIRYLTLELWLSSRKLALMAALSFCTTALSSAIVLAALTLRMNCLTAVGSVWGY